jgi:short-subunit dehydrogenase
MTDMPSMENQVVLITGASAGIGEALAREFARQGADLALLARREDRLAALATELRASGRRALAVSCDVTDDASVTGAVERVRAALGPPSVVVANAGFGVVGTFDRLGLDDYRRQFETNVFGVIRTAAATLTDLERTRGSLVLLGSVAGYVSMPGASPYGMSKFALRALAQSLLHELRPRGVAVTLVSPGFVDSEIRQVNNRGELHAEVPDPIPAWLRMPTDKAARQIARAVARRRKEIVVTAHGKAAAFLMRHAPWLIDGVIARFGIRSRREPDRA